MWIYRFALAYGASARWGTGFVLRNDLPNDNWPLITFSSGLTVLETVGPQYRAVVGMAIQFGWALGYVIMPGAAYLLRDFRWIQLAVTLPEFVLLLWWCSLPESPRWQLTHGKHSDAQKAIRRAAEINGRPTQSVETKLNKLMAKALAVSFKPKIFFETKFLWLFLRIKNKKKSTREPTSSIYAKHG